MTAIFYHTIYWKNKEGTNYGAYPTDIRPFEKALADFNSRFKSLIAVAVEPWVDWCDAGYPSDKEPVLERLKELSYPEGYTLSKARKATEHLRPQAEVLVELPTHKWTDAEIDGLLGKPVGKPAAPREPNNLALVRPFPNAWGRGA